VPLCVRCVSVVQAVPFIFVSFHEMHTMLKIGIIGLGDIARKAYLPILGTKNAEVHLCTRNAETLVQVGKQYRLTHLHQNLESLIDSGISGAFLHSATASHGKIIEQLLSGNLHVYVDKPITYDYGTAEKLVALAQQRNRVLMVGFNRRFAPAYQKLKELKEPNMILMQKNRRSLPGDVRTFIFDDFIHVVDTLRYLFPYTIEKLIVNGKKKDNLLHQVTVQFISAGGNSAIGIMNRDSGTVEEVVEVFTPQVKGVVYNLGDVVLCEDKTVTRLMGNDWEPTLRKRGFEQIIDHFLEIIQTPSVYTSYGDALATHKICEQIVGQLE